MTHELSGWETEIWNACVRDINMMPPKSNTLRASRDFRIVRAAGYLLGTEPIVDEETLQKMLNQVMGDYCIDLDGLHNALELSKGELNSDQA